MELEHSLHDFDLFIVELEDSRAKKAFLDYLKGQEAMTVFQRVGFSPVG